MAFHPRPKILRPVALPARLVATLFPTRTNAPVPLPPSIGMLTSSDGESTFVLIYPAYPAFFPSTSPAASSASPAPEPPKSQARPSGPSTEPKAHPNVNVPGPPSKRRRAKRTEEERIQYLRSDAYVAQFDAYRVLCASCDKWIRLRPNSTFCSIPWDAHRKSCLARKGCVICPGLLFISYILNVS
jgi:hypothetical protein